MAFTMGPIVFVVVVFGGLGSLTGCFIASLLMGLIQDLRRRARRVRWRTCWASSASW
jgi:branched-subunit amino acid ABC-type transport system permease component